MKTETLTRFDTDVQRLVGVVTDQTGSVATLRQQLGDALAAALKLAAACEAGEDQFVDGKIPEAILQDLRLRHKEAEANAKRVSSELQIAERMFAKSQQALVVARARAEKESRDRAARAVAEICAPLLQSAIDAFEKLQALPSFKDYVADWSARVELRDDRSPSSRHWYAQLSSLLFLLTSGDHAFVCDLIRDLPADLVSHEMKSFAARFVRVSNERAAAATVERDRLEKAAKDGEARNRSWGDRWNEAVLASVRAPKGVQA